jgi:hypothetical protein
VIAVRNVQHPSTTGMDNSASRGPDLLALERLRSTDIGKVDKDSLIKTYIDSQIRHAKSYAEEGRALLSSWSLKSPQSCEPADCIYPDFGFDTPLLKPRIADPSDHEGRVAEGTLPVETAGGKEPTASRASLVKVSGGICQRGLAVPKMQALQPTTVLPVVEINVPSKKRDCSADTDDGHTARAS